MYNTYCVFQAPYRIEMDVSALLLVDIHGHLSPKCEVIGLLGGVFRPSENILCIKMAVPCRTILSSNVHCDMCPGKLHFFYSIGLCVPTPSRSAASCTCPVCGTNTLHGWAIFGLRLMFILFFPSHIHKKTQ